MTHAVCVTLCLWGRSGSMGAHIEVQSIDPKNLSSAMIGLRI